MTAILSRGGNVLLVEEAPGIERVRVVTGWSGPAGPTGPGSQGGRGGRAPEVDGVLVLVDEAESNPLLLLTGQVPNPTEGIAATSPPPEAGGGAEEVVVTLDAVPAHVSRVQFAAAIYAAAGRGQSFRAAPHGYVRLYDAADGREVAGCTFEVETGYETALVFGELYRHPAGWKFRAVGEGYANGLPGLAGVPADRVLTAGPPVARPADVASWVARLSPTRTRRKVADHLRAETRPAAPAAPAPAAPAPAAPALAARPASPAASSRGAATAPATAPGAPKPPPRPAQPPLAPPPLAPPRVPGPAPGVAPAASAASAASAAPTAPREAASSPLDLGRADVDSRPAAVEASRRSSRYRQRHEHVTTLDDNHPATIWTGEQRGTGAMTVSLHWTPLTTRSGLPRPSNIHFGCLWQALDGAAGVIQQHGGSPTGTGRAGRQTLRLVGRDERDAQTIFVDLGTLSTFKRFFVFAYGLHRAPEWDLLRPVVVVAARNGEQLTIRLGNAPVNTRTCVAVSFHVVGDDLVIRRENDFLEGTQADAAERYGWSLEWSADGTVPRDAA